MERIDTSRLRVRINRITLNNIKCVSSGSISFNATQSLRDDKASIMGIYGQNGSGKTVVIEALAILKSILSGRQISNRYLESIRFGEKQIGMEIEFAVNGNENTDFRMTPRHNARKHAKLPRML